jgi:hypothetical protein
MLNAARMRQNAENCLGLAEAASRKTVRLRYMRMAIAWTDLAELQDWLDGSLPSSPPLQPKLDNAA